MGVCPGQVAILRGLIWLDNDKLKKTQVWTICNHRVLELTQNATRYVQLQSFSAISDKPGQQSQIGS